MAHFYYFPESVIELQKELLNHPTLMERLGKHDMQEVEIKIAEIAAYCDVVLDGDYTNEMLETLCGILVQRLKNKRPDRSTGFATIQ